MTGEEIVKAMHLKVPVTYKGITYKRITEYVLTLDDDGHQRRSASMLDMNNNCIVRGLIKDIVIAEQAS